MYYNDSIYRERGAAMRHVIEYDKRTNLLRENAYEYELQNVDDGVYFRDVFPYTDVPKIAFNYRNVPLHMPDEIWVTDTTFRDGQQALSPFTPEQILKLYRLEAKLGGPKGIIRQSEFFPYSERDKKAIRLCREAGLPFPEITTWIRAADADFELVKDLEIRETGILVSCSDYHIFKKMHLSRAEAMDRYLGIVKKALDYGIVPRCHFEDVTRADYYGFVVPFATALMRLSRESGTPIKIRLCDTLGFGVSFPGVALPRSVQGIVYGLIQYADVPSEQMEWHGHNDFYKSVNNAATAWLYGCSGVNATLLGIGERTGNCPIEAMLFEYAQLRGTTDGICYPAITEIAEFFEEEIGYSIPANTPFVGSNFNATRAGIHADGLLKDEEIYNVFDTSMLLHRPPYVIIDRFCGLAGVAHWINSYYRLPTELCVDKRSALVETLKEEIDHQYRHGRSTSFQPSEVDALIRKADPAFHTTIHSL